MSDKKKTNLPGGLKGFKFKIYWIYALIFVFFIGLNFMGTMKRDSSNFIVKGIKEILDIKVNKQW